MNQRITDTDLARTAPGTVGGQFMRRFWQPVYRSEDLKVGHAKPVKIMSFDFTLYRGETGVAHAVDFRCSHRGSQLSIGFIEGDCIRCFFHGWKFDQNGKSVERPGDREGDRPAADIRAYPTEEYLGLIFVWFGEGEAPPLPRFKELEVEGLRDVTVDVLPCNFFYSLENDATHFPFAHRDLLPTRNLSGIPEVWAEETDFGVACYDRWPGSNAVGVAHKGIPNVGYIVPTAIMLAKNIKFALHVSWRVPVDDEKHVTYRVNLIPCSPEQQTEIRASRPANFEDRSVIPLWADAVLAGAMRLEDIKDRTHIEVIQDYVAQVGQGDITTRDNEQLSKADSSVVTLRRIWKREMQAMVEGREMKNWRLTDAVTPVNTVE